MSAAGLTAAAAEAAAVAAEAPPRRRRPARLARRHAADVPAELQTLEGRVELVVCRLADALDPAPATAMAPAAGR
jgi:hypothetical protein